MHFQDKILKTFFRTFNPATYWDPFSVRTQIISPFTFLSKAIAKKLLT